MGESVGPDCVTHFITFNKSALMSVLVKVGKGWEKVGIGINKGILVPSKQC